MAVVVSHAMRRFASSPDANYSSCGFRSEASSRLTWSPGPAAENSESSLSRSMRYADPWLYESVRAAPPGGLLLAPALVLCSCADYLNGTKRSSKKAPSTCKKCKGTRIPLSNGGEAKFGTMRCYPTSPTAAALSPARAGTVRVTSSSRPSILPSNADPYDLMRRSRLTVAEKGSNLAASPPPPALSASQFRARSVSPHKATKPSEGRTTRSHDKNVKYPTVGRKSILECSVNPYELMSSGQGGGGDDITLVNGQRIRVRPPINIEPDYEDVQIQQHIKLKTPMQPAKSHIPIPKLKQLIGSGKNGKVQNGTYSLKQYEKELQQQQSVPPIVTILECNGNRFKSILKKPSAMAAAAGTTFGDTDSSGTERGSPSPPKSGSSHFYLPMPTMAAAAAAPSPPSPTMPVRKKVQFMVEHERIIVEMHSDSGEEPPYDDLDNEQQTDETTTDDGEEEQQNHYEVATVISTTAEAPPPPPPLPDDDDDGVQREQTDGDATPTPAPASGCRLRRSESERALKELPTACAGNKVVFHDSMALRGAAQTRRDARIVFSDKDLERLDGITNAKLNKGHRPAHPPPQPPQRGDVHPPAAPPRKRSNNRAPVLMPENNAAGDNAGNSNKTVLRISNDNVHKVKIKNDFAEHENGLNVNTIAVSDSALGKTSIMINGDDCYSTIKVCDEIPLYHSSVVVRDTGVVITPEKRSSSVYITGNFINTPFNEEVKSFENYQDTHNISVETQQAKETQQVQQEGDGGKAVVVLRNKDLQSSDLLKCLSNPVEAVRMNLVPHICGRHDPPRRPREQKPKMTVAPPPLPVASESPQLAELQTLSEEDKVAKFIEESFIKLRNNSIIDVDDKDSEHSSSTQYEIMDHGSDCYTDHSNRSSITEEELNARTKFYELLADSAIVEVSESEDHHYECIKVNPDPIYEEIEIPPPLPANPPPSNLLDELQIDKEYTTRSIFEGASKYDILSYLVDAKERGIVPEDSYTYNYDNVNSVEEEGKDNGELPYNRVSHMSTVSDSSEDSSLVMPCTLTDDASKSQRSAEVERNDSGVGSETSKSSLSKYRSKPDVINVTCEDCEAHLDTQIQSEHEPLVCRKCIKKRTERKEIITEIVETEEKYSRDLQIILEEFYQPMLVAGLLTSDQLSAIFLNVEELLENSQALAERLRDAVEIAGEQGDEDLQTVNIGKLILEAAPMLHAFETYCVRQGAASLLLAGLEKDKELLRIFLRVSQMENTVLRRMNLNSFLMVPVQRVTKYPLLLARLYKVTPGHFENRDQLKEAQHKIELHLNHMNSETKDVPSKLWRRISSIPGRRSSSEMDLVNIKLRKIAVDVLEWNHDEAKFALEGRLLFTQPTDNNWRKGRTIKLTPINALLVTNGKSASTRGTESGDESLVFSRQTGVRDAALLLVRDKNGRYTLLREPLYLDRCVIAADPAWQSYFEVQELLGKDTFIFKAEDEEQTKLWYRQLQYYAQGMGAWRKRRNALANIMINGMGLRS